MRGALCLLLPALLLLSVLSCVKYRIPTPAGFVEFHKDKYYKAISSDGVKVRVTRVDNDPPGDLKMWESAMNHFLSGNGYRLVGKEELSGPERLRGFYREYVYRYNGENYRYSISIYVDEKNIYIIEAGGQEAFYLNRKKDLLRSISGFNPAG